MKNQNDDQNIKNDVDNLNNDKKKIKRKKRVIFRNIFSFSIVFIALTIIAGEIYAATQGYGNLITMVSDFFTNNSNYIANTENKNNKETNAKKNNTTTEQISKKRKDIDDFNISNAKKTFEKYVVLAEYYGGAPYLLVELGLESASDMSKLLEKNSKKTDYFASDIKYYDFKNEMLKYMSKTRFDEQFGKEYPELDGYVAIRGFGYGGVGREIVEFNFLEQNEKQNYCFEVKFRYVDDYEDAMGSDSSKKPVYTINLIMKEYNGDLVVDEANLT